VIAIYTVYTFNKTLLHIFDWAQAAPTRYRIFIADPLLLTVNWREAAEPDDMKCCTDVTGLTWMMYGFSFPHRRAHRAFHKKTSNSINYHVHKCIYVHRPVEKVG